AGVADGVRAGPGAGHDAIGVAGPGRPGQPPLPPGPGGDPVNIGRTPLNSSVLYPEGVGFPSPGSPLRRTPGTHFRSRTRGALRDPGLGNPTRFGGKGRSTQPTTSGGEEIDP